MTLNTHKFTISGLAALLFGALLLAPASSLYASGSQSDRDANTQRAFADSTRLEAMAEAAECAAEHGEVAKHYRLRSEQLEAKAVRHEEKAAALEARPKGPMHHKWPAMAQKPWTKERDLAVQARRAANEAQMLANKHVQLGMENIAATCNNSRDEAVGVQ